MEGNMAKKLKLDDRIEQWQKNIDKYKLDMQSKDVQTKNDAKQKLDKLEIEIKTRLAKHEKHLPSKKKRAWKIPVAVGLAVGAAVLAYYFASPLTNLAGEDFLISLTSASILGGAVGGGMAGFSHSHKKKHSKLKLLEDQIEEIQSQHKTNEYEDVDAEQKSNAKANNSTEKQTKTNFSDLTNVNLTENTKLDDTKAKENYNLGESSDKNIYEASLKYTVYSKEGQATYNIYKYRADSPEKLANKIDTGEKNRFGNIQTKLGAIEDAIEKGKSVEITAQYPTKDGSKDTKTIRIGAKDSNKSSILYEMRQEIKNKNEAFIDSYKNKISKKQKTSKKQAELQEDEQQELVM